MKLTPDWLSFEIQPHREKKEAIDIMAIPVQTLIMEAFISLCEKKPLEKITVRDLQTVTGISRQTFYNHFRDRDDLIQQIYLHRIIPLFDEARGPSMPFSFEDALCRSFYNMRSCRCLKRRQMEAAEDTTLK